MKETLTVLNSINEKLRLVVEMLSATTGQVKPKYVEVAEKILAASNATLEEVIPADTIEAVSEETPLNEELEIGSIITYIGDRKTLSGKQGTIVEVKNAWVVVAFDGEGKNSRVNHDELTLGVSEQPPEETQVEALIAEEEAVAEALFDDEAASYKIERGSFKDYRDIHAIYSDQKKMVGNRKYLRFRALKVMGGDALTQEMCHRYLVGIEDEEHMKAYIESMDVAQ